MKCEWCGRENDSVDSPCRGCGQKREVSKSRKIEPYYHRGFMIWPEIDLCSRDCEFHIWLGDRRIGSFAITFEMRQAYRQEFGEGVNGEDLIDRLLRLTLGDTEVEKYEALNNGRKFNFEIRRLETPEYLEAKNLIMELMNG